MTFTFSSQEQCKQWCFLFAFLFTALRLIASQDELTTLFDGTTTAKRFMELTRGEVERACRVAANGGEDDDGDNDGDEEDGVDEGGIEDEDGYFAAATHSTSKPTSSSSSSSSALPAMSESARALL